MRLVIIESPFAGDVEANEKYLNRCLKHSLKKGEAPFASHGLYTRPGVLDDTVKEDRELGIGAGFAWRKAAAMTVVYIDNGITKGMIQGVVDSLNKSIPVSCRSLDGKDVVKAAYDLDRQVQEVIKK